MPSGHFEAPRVLADARKLRRPPASYFLAFRLWVVNHRGKYLPKLNMVSIVNAKQFVERFDRLRFSRNWTIEQAAKAIGLSRTMVHFIKKGKHLVSDKVLFRLEYAERASGFAVPEPGWMNEIRSHESAARTEIAKTAMITVTQEDVRRGSLTLPIEFRRGKAPSGFPKQIRITAVGANEAARLLPEIFRNRDRNELLLKSLPKKFRRDAFLDQLTAPTVLKMARAAVLLSYGITDGTRLLESIRR